MNLLHTISLVLIINVMSEFEWNSVEDQLPPRIVPGSDLSESVEVHYDLGGRSIDQYNFSEEMWESDLESLARTGMVSDGKITHWKFLEPGPNNE